MKLLENRRTGNRQGVALILVVGMLALMMVMGVTFSIFMRTERLAAGHFRAGVQTRELLQVALARALDDIEFSVGTAVYPPWSILESGGLGDIHTNALSGSISNWIPLAVLEATNPAPRWIDIPSGGRVAYLVLNCSGLIDVNNAGGSIRASGTNVSEIQIATLPDIGTDANAAALVAGRPYETMQELGVKAAAALTGLPKNLVVYSNFPTNYSGGADLGLVDLSGGVSNLQDRKTGIISGLNKSGIPLSDQLFVYSNLLYYVDPSPVPMTPDDLGSPLTKSVPMINEVRVTNSVIMVGGGKSVTLVTVDIEWFYPFVKKSPFSFDIVCDVEITGISSTLGKYVPPRIVSQSKPSAYAGQTGPYYERVQFSTATNVTFTSNDTVQLAFKIGAKVLRGSDIVDSVPYPYDSASYLSATGMLMDLPSSLSGGVKGYECVDPRFNWSTLAAGAQWIAYTLLNPSGTIKLPNWITGKLFPNKYLGLYVAGEPLHNVGELSYLLRGAKVSDKWSSIRIFTNSSVAVDRVLDNFMVQVSTNSRGLVNVNSRSADVLGTVFSGIQKEAYPGAGGAPVTPAEVASLATAVMNQNLSPISRMSDYGTNTALMSIVNPAGTLTPFQAESVLRESAGLLHYRQNLFLVLLYAQPNKTSNNTSGSQAMAEIWRDPVANSQSNHPCFVRSFKILNQ